MKQILKANLPQSRVSAVAISCKAGEAIKKLNELNIKTFIIEAEKRLPEPVNSHTDLQLVHFGNNKLFVQNEQLFVGNQEKDFQIIKISSEPNNIYPNDVRLNCAIIGNKIICNTKTIAKEILDYAYKTEMTVINVNQGYSKCSVCIVNENAIITDDKSIFSAAGNFLNDVLFVSKGSIELKGYNYGFIGGCCGKIDKNVMAFNGAIESHTDYNSIIDFLDKHSVKCLELHKNKLNDIGGIIPLYEF